MLRRRRHLLSLEEEPFGLEARRLRKGCLRTAVVSKVQQNEDGSTGRGKTANGVKLLLWEEKKWRLKGEGMMLGQCFQAQKAAERKHVASPLIRLQLCCILLEYLIGGA